MELSAYFSLLKMKSDPKINDKINTENGCFNSVKNVVIMFKY